MRKKEIEVFQKNLLEWYDQHARVLPWRNQPTPYRVWISEIMLQQTRVDTVKPYFERFINQVHDIGSLAQLDEEKLLKLWEGLGYYNRARNMKKTAQILVQRYNGQFPSNYEELLHLPGIGPYTAGAIASIALNQKTKAVDGNVFRVMLRIEANENDIRKSKVRKLLTNQVESLLPDERVGDFNQALMELGATICLPNGTPKCYECPVSCICQSFKKNIQNRIPVKSAKKKRRIEQRTVFVMEYQGNIFLNKRHGDGLLPNLWEFPNVEDFLSYADCEEQLKQWGITTYQITPLNHSVHIFSHLEWHMCAYKIEVEQLKLKEPWLLLSKEEIRKNYSIPIAFKEYTKNLFK